MESKILPTESDAEWVSEALDGVIPSELDARVWLPLPETEYNGQTANQFCLKGQNLTVLAVVAPMQITNSDVKQVAYHIITYRRDGDKLKKPNTADINRVRSSFFCRDLKPEEKVYEGVVGDSRAYHIMTAFEHKPIIVVGG